MEVISDPRPGGPSAVAFVFGVLQAEAVPGPVLVSLIAELGAAEPATRTVLSRMVQAGQLTTTRHGRMAVYRLSGGFRDQFTRVRHGDEPQHWPGYFHTIVYEVHETLRADRDALRDRAAQAGFGTVRPGLLIGLTDPAGWIGEWSQRTDILVEPATLHCPVPTARRLATVAWSLNEVAAEQQRYLAWLTDISAQCSDGPPTPAESFTLLNGVMRAYAGLHLVMPSVPDELTTPDWPGRLIPAALGRVALLIGPPAAEHAAGAVDALDLGDLVEPLDDRLPDHRSAIIPRP